MSGGLALLRSRLPVLLGVAALAFFLLLGTHSRGSVSAAWQALDIPAMSVTFADTRMVTYPIDCVIEGVDPYDRSLCHPLESVYNYPPIWLSLRYLGVTSRSSVLIGVILETMFVVALLILFKAERWISAAVVFAGILSRPPLFAVERGNIDLAIFSLMVFGLFLIDRKKTGAKSFFSSILIVFLTVLKIYPIAAVAVFLRNRKGFRTALVTGVLAISALLLTSGRDLIPIIRNTPQKVLASYGAFPFLFIMGLHTFRSVAVLVENHRWIASAGGAVLAAIAVCAGVLYGKGVNRFLPPLDFDSAIGRVAVACLAIYCFTFLIGSAFDYRLIFLLGVLAYLVHDLNKRVSLRSLPACIVLLCFLWMPITRWYLPKQILDGLVFMSASGWLGSTLLICLRKTESGNSAERRA
jgi:glycosyl transferase family 87